MRWYALSLLVVCFSAPVGAHHPDRENHPVWPRFDLIPPLGNSLPMEYRRRYNRPRYVGGWIAYHIAPSSQEAMAWHDAAHQRAYADHRGRLEKHFFYPKPWESLKIGPRVSVLKNEGEEQKREADRKLLEALKAEEDVLSASDDPPDASQLIEQERYRQQQADETKLAPPPIEAPAEAQEVELQPSDK